MPWWEVGNEVNVGTSANPGWMDGSAVSYANQHCASPSALACLYDFGGTTGFRSQPVGDLADTSAQAALSTGQPAQAKDVTYPPVAPGTLTVDVDGQLWTQTASLATAPATATVYQLDAATGKITFGDGVHGAIPPDGSQITASYDSGPHAGFAEYYRAMKAVNPAIHVCLGASSVFPGIGAYLQDLGTAHPYDCVPTHPYVRDGTSLAGGEISNSLPQAEYDTELLALPSVLAGQVRHVRQEIDAYAGPRAARVSIPITEFGQLRSSRPDSDASYFHMSLQEGPDTFVEPAGFVEQLFRPLGGEQQATVGTRAMPGISLPDGSTLPALETVAGHQGNQVTLVVVNQSGTASVPTAITVPGRWPRSGSITTLDGASALAYNSPADPTAVSLRTGPLQATAGHLAVTFPAHSVSLIRLVTGAGRPHAGSG